MIIPLGFRKSPNSDEYAAYTALYLPMTGSVGNTYQTDTITNYTCPTTVPVAAVGGINAVAFPYKFGMIDNNPNVNLQTSQWCIDFWVYRGPAHLSGEVIGQTYGTGWKLKWNLYFNADVLNLGGCNPSTTAHYWINTTCHLKPSDWNHIAVCKYDDTKYFVFVNGVLHLTSYGNLNLPYIGSMIHVGYHTGAMAEIEVGLPGVRNIRITNHSRMSSSATTTFAVPALTR